MKPSTVIPRRTALRAATIAVAVAVAAGVPTALSAATAAASASTSYTGTLANGTTWIADVPDQWNGTLLLYSHGFGPLTAADAPDPGTQAALLARGYALAGSSYDPNGSEWALDTAVSDQFGALAAVESTVLPSRPAHVLAFGTSMGGLISALEAQQGAGKINGALTTCGIVGGGVNLNEYQIDGEYAIAQLLGNPSTQLVGFGDVTTALATASALTADATAAQATAAGRARLALALAFLNTTPWLSTSTTPVPASDPNGQEAAQYNVMFGGGFSIMDFIELGRVSVDQADGGNATWDAGTNFARALAGSPFKNEVEALYKAAGPEPERRPRDAHREHHDQGGPGGAAVARRHLRSDRPALGSRTRPAHDRRQPRPGPERELLPAPRGPGRQRRAAPAGVHGELRALQLQLGRARRGRPGGHAPGDHRPLGQRRDGSEPGTGGHRLESWPGPVRRLPPG